MEESPRTQTSSEWVHVTGNPASTTDASPPDGTSSDHQTPPAKRRKEDRERSRVSRACDRCKKKKTRCTGRCPCPLCLRAGLPCEFTASYTRGRLPSVVVDEAAMAAQSRPRITTTGTASTPDTSVVQGSATPSFQFPKYSDATSPAEINGSHSINAFGGADRLAVPNDDRSHETVSRASPEPQIDQQGHYIGPASGVSFLIRIQKTLHQNSSVSHDSSIFTFGDAPLPDYDPTFFVLPPKADAQKLVDRYFDFAAPTHRFLHRPTIDKLLQEFYETQGDMQSKGDAPGRTALLLMVFAQGQVYMPPGTYPKDHSARYYFAAERQLSKERGAVRLTSVQARLGQCFYLLTQSRINHCWSLFGTMAHLAFAIGLNRSRRGDSTATTDYIELESRRRLFWCAYTLDKYLAAALGRPRTFKDEDIDQEMPNVVDDNDLHRLSMKPLPAKSMSDWMAPVEHFKISRIVSLILRDLYAVRPPSMGLRIELAAKYSRDLREWRSNLAPFLSADDIDSSLLIPLFSRQRRVLNLAFHHATLLIQRPFLLSNFANLSHISANSPQPFNVDTSQNINECAEAAMGIVNIVDEMFQTSQIFRSFWFTQYYAFCAVVVLYIYRIQQHIVSPGKCEGYFTAGQRCQAQLDSISDTDSMCKRYCLVLEELRLEAARHTNQHNRPQFGASASPSDTTGVNEGGNNLNLAPVSNGLNIPSSSPQPNPGVNFTPNYYSGIGMPTPESTIFGSNFMSSNSLMADLTSWGSFDSLVTAGIGLDIGNGWSSTGTEAFGFGLGR